MMTSGRGSTNVATNFPFGCAGWRGGVGRLLVADDACDRRFRGRTSPYAEPRERRDTLHRRWLSLLPCRAWPARSAEARRRPRAAIAVRDLLRSEYLAGFHRRHRAMDRSTIRQCGDTGGFSVRHALFPGVSLHHL